MASTLLANQQTPLSSATLNETLHQQIEHLVRQFNTLIVLASSGASLSPPDSPSNGQQSSSHMPPPLASAAVQTYRITAETQALVTSIESLTALTRRMKEAWVFGELETIGTSKDVEKRTEEDVKEVIAGLLQPKDPAQQADQKS